MGVSQQKVQSGASRAARVLTLADRLDRLDDVKAVAVEVRPAECTKCARSWKILPSVGSDPAYPDVTPRDAQALREWDALRKAAE